jgi:DNA-binding MarR family transcriptional regulator
VVKLELDGLGIHDINNVQGLMLFNIGDAEMTVGELTLRGCYLGSNVSYNVKKMVENGYLAQERSVHDRRSIHVRLTEKGSQLRDRLQSMHQRRVEMLIPRKAHLSRFDPLNRPPRDEWTAIARGRSASEPTQGLILLVALALGDINPNGAAILNGTTDRL